MGEKPLLVCIDDDPPVLAAIRRLFRREPYELVTLGEPSEVIDLIEARRVDLIIADQRMPGILGTDLLKTIRQKSPTTACVILTGHADLSDIAGAMNDGAVDRLIRKPWNDEDFRKMIRQLLVQRSDRKEPHSGGSDDDEEHRSPRIVRKVECSNRRIAEVLSDLAVAVEDPGAAPGIVLVLEGLPTLAGSLNVLLSEIVRLIVKQGIRATLVDGSGAAGTFLELVGGRLPLVVYRSEQEMGSPKTILVVEDQPENLEYLKILIESAGHECIAVGSVGEAIRRLTSMRFDLVLLDLVLPDAEGIEVARHILERQLATPVIAISGFLDQWNDGRISEVGIRKQLSKPYRAREILDAIRDS
jgi:CheY-like chemotaxis protein